MIKIFRKITITLCSILMLSCSSPEYQNDFIAKTIELGELGQINNVIQYYKDDKKYIICRKGNHVYGMLLPQSIFESNYPYIKKVRSLAALGACRPIKADDREDIPQYHLLK